jgi:hypothetical protein
LGIPCQKLLDADNCCEDRPIVTEGQTAARNDGGIGQQMLDRDIDVGPQVSGGALMTERIARGTFDTRGVFFDQKFLVQKPRGQRRFVKGKEFKSAISNGECRAFDTGDQL